MKKTVFLRVLLTVLSLLAVGAVFFNSSLDADVSSEQSGAVLGMLGAFFERLHLPFILTEHIVRKAAQFSEYFILGALFSATVRSYTPKAGRIVTASLGLGFLTACADEFIQTFSAGRSGEFKDVMLDFCGAAAAVMICALIAKHADRKKTKKETKKVE